MNVSNAIVQDLLNIMEKERRLLKEEQTVSLKDYLSDEKLQHIVERAFQQAIQACIDIGARIISQKNFRAATDYHDIFIVLSEEKVITIELADKMKEMVGFRNALVHEYRAISHREAHRHLQKSLGIFQEFAEHIIKFLEVPKSRCKRGREK